MMRTFCTTFFHLFLQTRKTGRPTLNRIHSIRRSLSDCHLKMSIFIETCRWLDNDERDLHWMWELRVRPLQNVYHIRTQKVEVSGYVWTVDTAQAHSFSGITILVRRASAICDWKPLHTDNILRIARLRDRYLPEEEQRRQLSNSSVESWNLALFLSFFGASRLQGIQHVIVRDESNKRSARSQSIFSANEFLSANIYRTTTIRHRVAQINVWKSYNVKRFVINIQFTLRNEKEQKYCVHFLLRTTRE